MAKKIICMLLALSMVLAMLAACNNEPVDDVENSGSENDISVDNPDTEGETSENPKYEESPEIYYYETVISEFDDESEGWLSNGSISVQETESLTESPYFMASAFGDTVFYKHFLDNPFDFSLYADEGVLHLNLYVEDASVIYGGQIEFTSSAGSDSFEYHWGELGRDIPIQNGWNELNLPFSQAIEQNNPADLEEINYMRIYLNSGAEVKLGLDDMYLYMNTERKMVDVSVSVGENSIVKKYFTGMQLKLSEFASLVTLEGYDIIGWNLDNKNYGLDDTFIVEDSISISAILESWQKYKIVYSDGFSSFESDEFYAGSTVKLASSSFKKEGYTFAGWQDSFGKAYKPGHSYVINSENNDLVPIWKEISDYNLLADAQEAWELCEGGPYPIAYSAIGKSDAELKWTVWLNSETFGQVLDFSTSGSVMTAKNTNVDISKDFAISAWIKAPKRGSLLRTVVASGDKWAVILDENGCLAFTSSSLASVESSGVNLVDGKWHHILVSRNASELTYYIDGVAAKKVSVNGAVMSDEIITVGALTDGNSWFDGSIAQVRIYGKAKTPAEVTNITVVESDNIVKEAVFSYYKGITTDRSQGFGTEGGMLLADDVLNCKKMGFEFIRMMIYVDNLVGKGGKLNEEYIKWSVDFINTILDNGMRCMISLGCGDRDKWNGKYLGTTDGFEDLVVFYGELTEWIKAQGWTSQEVSLLMFTEPVNKSLSMNWTWMSDRLCAAVRNVDPDITIITSSEDTGNIEYIKKMSPVTDDNVVYSFTSYEPYTVGFNSFNEYGVADSWWHYVKDIPYPIEEGVDYTDAIESAIENVPEDLKGEARKVLNRYVLGRNDVWRSNPYKNTLYNADWFLLRAESLNEWSEKNGGNIHLFVAEFGACDSIANINLGAKSDSGLSEETRLKLINDSRESYDAYNIGWSFWQYNESFTIYRPQVRTPYWCVTEAEFEAHVYPELLEALGLPYQSNN